MSPNAPVQSSGSELEVNLGNEVHDLRRDKKNLQRKLADAQNTLAQHLGSMREADALRDLVLERAESVVLHVRLSEHGAETMPVLVAVSDLRQTPPREWPALYERRAKEVQAAAQDFQALSFCRSDRDEELRAKVRAASAAAGLEEQDDPEALAQALLASRAELEQTRSQLHGHKGASTNLQRANEDLRERVQDLEETLEALVLQGGENAKVLATEMGTPPKGKKKRRAQKPAATDPQE